MFTIWHNAKCSKSRATRDLLDQNNISVQDRYYLKEIPSIKEIQEICEILNVHPIAITRKNETIWKKNNINPESITDEELFEYLHQFPIAIERPIVISADEKTGKKSAIIGRPPENVLKLL